MIKNVGIWCIVILLCFTYVFPVFGVESQFDLSTEDGFKGIDAQAQFLGSSKLVDNVSSAFLFELNSDSLLYSWDADKPQYPASLVKIMTALLVLENGNLSDVVTVSQNALDSVSYDAISVDLLPGENISVEDLLYCLMVKSANDAAAVLAEYVCGSQSEFVMKMNNRALELGCTGTNYTNPHGLHDDQQVTTARDTCRILKEALKHDFFRTIYGTIHYTVPATNLSEERILSTNNFLMNSESVGIYFDSRVIGGRTGVTSDGYRCIASVAQNRNMEVICIVMGSVSQFAENGSTEVYGGFPETITLLNYGFDGNDTFQVLYKNQVLQQKPVLNGDSDVFIIVKDSFSTVLPAKYSFDDLTFVFSDPLDHMEAPIEKGQSMGSVKVLCENVCVAETDIYAANSVAVATSIEGSYIEPTSKGFIWIFLVLLLILGITVLFLVFRKRKRIKPRSVHYETVTWRGEQ